MPLPRHDEQILPSRRALRQAERARAAGSGAPLELHSRRSLRPRTRAAGRVRMDAAPIGPVVVPPTAPAVERVIADHVLEGGDDTWVDDVAPRPTPVGSQFVAEPRRPSVVRDPRGSAWRRLPQALVVGSLVAATVGYATTTDIAATAGSVPEFVRQETAVAPVVDSAIVAADLDGGSALIAGEDGLLRVRGAEEASRGGDRTLLPGCDGVPPESPQANGNIDEQFLCTLWDGKTEIRADAAVSLALLNESYRAEFGSDLCMTDGYRSFAAQQSLRSRKPGLAAPAGTSNHGLGLAVDLCGGVESAGAAYYWLRDNAPTYGFDNPDWARQGGGGPYEPWHWEYVDGQW